MTIKYHLLCVKSAKTQLRYQEMQKHVNQKATNKKRLTIKFLKISNGEKSKNV